MLIITRGIYGFIKNNELKVTFCSSDSYLEGLGNKMVDFINNTSIKELNEIFDEITFIDFDNLPSMEELFRCHNILCDLNLSSKGSIKDWDNILGVAEWNPEVYKNGFKYMTDDKEFMSDKFFCEYSYLINLDKNLFVINCNNGIAMFDLDNISSDWIDNAKIQMGIFEKEI